MRWWLFAASLAFAAEPLLPTTQEEAEESPLAAAVEEAVHEPPGTLTAEADKVTEEYATRTVEEALPVAGELFGNSRPATSKFIWAYLSLLGCGVAWAVLCMGQPRAISLCSRKTPPADFGQTLTMDVAKTVRTIAEAACCWGCMWAEMVARKRILPFGVALALLIVVRCLEHDRSLLHLTPNSSSTGVWIVSLLCFSGFWLVRLYVRRRVRGASVVFGAGTFGCCADGLAHCFCIPCAVAQEALIVEMQSDQHSEYEKV